MLGAYFVLYPGSRVLTWIFPVFLVKIPAWIYLGLWFLYQLIAAFGLLVTQLLTRTGHRPPAENPPSPNPVGSFCGRGAPVRTAG